MIASLLALLLMQVGLNPATGGMPGVPEELRNRPPRERVTETKAEPAPRTGTALRECLAAAADDPDAALDYANAWRLKADNELDLAQSSHCLGLALTALDRFDDARQIFEVASAEAPPEYPAYRARLAAMAGNAALAEGKPATAEPLFAQALGEAAQAGDPALIASLHLDRAGALVAAGRLDEGGTALDAARAIDPANPRAWLLSATLARRQGKLDIAQQQIERAAELDPRSPATGLEAGVIAALSGRDAEARRSFQSVIDVAPDGPEAATARDYLAQLAG